MAFWKKRKVLLSYQDLEYLCFLLESELPLSRALELLQTKKNKEVLERIKKCMDEGMEAEKAFADAVPETLKDYLLPLVKVMPFYDALDLSLGFHSRHEKSQKEILSAIAYPCILLFVSLSVLYLFDMYGMDRIFSLVSSFGSDGGSILVFRKTVRFLISFFYILVLILLVLFLYFSSPKKVLYFYILLSKYFPDSLFHVYHSEEFISLFLELLHRGYKTRESMTILRSLKKRPVVCFLAYHLDEELSEGSSLKEAADQSYFDSSLSRFIRIASHTVRFSEILESYSALSREKIKKKAKRYALCIQLFSYAFIGVLIIFIYQVLFLPMQALSSGF